MSARAIDLAGNEAELAFLLVRPFVRAVHMSGPKVKFAKNWPKEMGGLSEEEWARILHSQSTKESNNFDVADEIGVDVDAVECISRAGYSSGAGLSYLMKLLQNKDSSWAQWYKKNMIGLSYRAERLGSLVPEMVEKGSFSLGKALNRRRFGKAVKYWDILL